MSTIISYLSPTSASSCDRDGVTLGDRIVDSLYSSNMPGLRRILIEIHNDVVTLRGQLSSFYERQMAVTRVEQTAGVGQVVDRLDVRPRRSSVRTAG